jgi:hypothetical protein
MFGIKMWRKNKDILSFIKVYEAGRLVSIYEHGCATTTRDPIAIGRLEPACV